MIATFEAFEKENDPGDSDLITRIAQGDESAFRHLVSRHGGLVYAIAFRMKFNRAAADDIAQETWLRVWKNAGRWDRAKGASVKTWICRIASNICIDGLRRNRRDGENFSEESIYIVAESQDHLETTDRQRAVAIAIQNLPARQRAALVMFHYEDLSAAEIASALGTSVKGVEGLLTRARHTLQAKLAQHMGVL